MHSTPRRPGRRPATRGRSSSVQPSQPLQPVLPSPLIGPSTLPDAFLTSPQQVEEETPTPGPSKRRKKATPKTPSSKAAGASHWHTDAPRPGDPSSFDLLLRWLALGDNWREFKHGKNGETGQRMADKCAEWLEKQGAPTRRTASSCQRKINTCWQAFKSSEDWLNSTGNGAGQLRIDAATGEDRDDVIKAVEDELQDRCFGFRQLQAIFAATDGGEASLRADSSSHSNPVFSRIAASYQGSQWRPPSPFSDAGDGDEQSRPDRAIEALARAAVGATQHGEETEDEDSAEAASSISTPMNGQLSQQMGKVALPRRHNSASGRIDDHLSQTIGQAKLYQDQKLKFKEMEIDLLRTSRKGEKYSKIWEVAQRIMAMDPDLTRAEAMREAKVSWEEMD